MQLTYSEILERTKSIQCNISISLISDNARCMIVHFFCFHIFFQLHVNCATLLLSLESRHKSVPKLEHCRKFSENKVELACEVEQVVSIMKSLTNN